MGSEAQQYPWQIRAIQYAARLPQLVLVWRGASAYPARPFADYPRAVLGGGGNRLHARSALHAVRVVDEVRHVELEADARQVEQPLHAARREARGGREYAEDLPCTLGWTMQGRVDHAR